MVSPVSLPFDRWCPWFVILVAVVSSSVSFDLWFCSAFFRCLSCNWLCCCFIDWCFFQWLMVSVLLAHSYTCVWVGWLVCIVWARVWVFLVCASASCPACIRKVSCSSYFLRRNDRVRSGSTVYCEFLFSSFHGCSGLALLVNLADFVY